MKTIISMAVVCVITLSALGVFAGETVELKPQTKCPITGLDIDKTTYVDAAGQRIYCSKGSEPVITQDPEAALQKLQDNGEFAESLQTMCPFMGNKINKKFYIEYKGRRLYVCCPPCINKGQADPAAFAKKVTEAVQK